MPAARRRLPMVELDATVEVVGPDGPVPPPRAAMDPPRRDPVDTLAGTTTTTDAPSLGHISADADEFVTCAVSSPV